MAEAFDPYRKWLAIPPEDQPPDHYRLLGVPRFEDDPDVIAAAADRQMSHLRTYQSGGHAALSQRLLNEVAAARICLLNSEKKAAYDQELRRQMEARVPARKPPVVARAASPPGGGSSGQETVEWTGLRELGEYRLIEKLGAGGMGEVFKAVHTEMDRVVAVKVLPPGHLQDERAVARFKREIKSVAKLDHPNIVRALDAREIEGTRFLVMEYVEGMDLRDVAKRLGPLPVAEACELIRQAALGLQCAHEHGLVHRDIKPSNLMLSVSHQPSAFSGQQANLDPLAPRPPSLAPLVKVLDLGLARPQAEQGEEEVTGTGEAMGTADYMAPEQAADSRSVNIRADLYSLGCTLYRLIAGRPPFTGPKYDTAVKKLMGHIQEPVPPITQFRPDAPKRLEILLGRLLAKDPAKRLATPAEVADALVPLAAGHDLAGLYARAASKIAPPPAPPRQATVATRSHPSSGLTRFLQRLGGGRPDAAPAASAPASHKKGFPPYVGYVAVAAVALLLVVALGVVLARRSADEEPVAKRPSADKGDSGARKSQAAAKTQWLILLWPADQREDATLEIDRWPRKIADLVDPKNPEQLRMEVTPGVHKVWIARRGFEPFEQTVKVEPGKDLTIRPEWVKPPDVAQVPVEKPKPEEKPAKPPEKPGPKDVVEKPPKPKEKPKPPQIDPALKRRQELDAKYAHALEPVEALVAAWDFRGAVAALAKIEFDEPDLMARRNARGRELQRLVALKARMIAKINAADPRLKKSSLMIKGMNGDVVRADESGITTKLASGKTESFAWEEIGTKAPQRLVALAIDRQKPDDWLAAGLLALASGDADSAEDSFAKARELGTDIGPYLAPLAAAAFAEAKALLEKREFTNAEAALADLESKYGKIPWFASHRASFDAARAAAEAEMLYAEAAALFKKEELFDVRPLVEKLKADYPNTATVTDTARKPTFAELEKAVAELGKMFTVRQDGKGDFKSIQEAIDAAPPNSLIEIQDNAQYAECVVMNKEGMILRGKEDVWPVITAVGSGVGGQPFLLVSASGTTIAHLAIVHSVETHGFSACVSVSAGPFRLRSALVYKTERSTDAGNRGFGTASQVMSELENAVILARSTEFLGPVTARNSMILQGNVAVEAPAIFENVVVSDLVGTAISRLRNCTIPGCVTFKSQGNGLVDSIVQQIDASLPGTRIDHCDVFSDKPFLNHARPGKACISAPPQFHDPKNLDYRLMPTSPCRGKASDRGDIGVRYTPEMIEMCKKALELRAKGIIKF